MCNCATIDHNRFVDCTMHVCTYITTRWSVSTYQQALQKICCRMICSKNVEQTPDEKSSIENRKIKITTLWLFNVFTMVQWFMIYDDFPVRYIKQLEGSFRVFHEHKFLQPQPVRMFCSLFTPLSASSRRVHHYSVLPRRIWRHYLRAKFGQPWSPTVKKMEENNDFKG